MSPPAADADIVQVGTMVAEAVAKVGREGAVTIDPAKVIRLALQDAASVAGRLLTTEVVIAERRETGRRARDGLPHGMNG